MEVDINEKKASKPKKIEEQPAKYTYDQLEAIAHQLSAENRQLYAKLNQANMNDLLARLNYLFKVLDHKDSFSKDFVVKCIKEIETIMTIPEEEENQEEENGKA